MRNLLFSHSNNITSKNNSIKYINQLKFMLKLTCLFSLNNFDFLVSAYS